MTESQQRIEETATLLNWEVGYRLIKVVWKNARNLLQSGTRRSFHRSTGALLHDIVDAKFMTVMRILV